MRKTLLAVPALLLVTASFAGVLNDADIPLLRDALKKNYTLELCRKDLPGASVETCQCLGNEIAKNLDAAKLKLCEKANYEKCVATEFTAAKSSLADKQIGDCQALTKEAAPAVKNEGQEMKVASPSTDEGEKTKAAADQPEEAIVDQPAEEAASD